MAANVLCVGGPLDGKTISIAESRYKVGFRFNIEEYPYVKLEPHGTRLNPLEAITHTYVLTEYVIPGGGATLRALHANT